MSPTNDTLTGAAGAPPLALVCGGGSFPIAVAESAIRDGRSVVLYPIRGFADAAMVERYDHEWIPLGAIDRFLTSARRRGCREVVIVGNVLRPHLWQIRLDWRTLRLLPRIWQAMRGGDDHLLSRVARFLEDQGFALLGAHEIAPDLLIPAGTLGKVEPRPGDIDDARMGLDLVRTLGPYDVGQSVVVARRHVQAVEAAEGTDWMLERCALMREKGRTKLPKRTGVLVKAPKPGQDWRVDLPSLGQRSVEMAARAGLAGIAVEAGGVMAVGIADMIREADRLGLFLYGLAE